jgi:MinD-like ATPase involved in chromosome partitioning or flagellar assembly
MSIHTARATIHITLRHPGGSINLAAPTDVPIGELMPDFLDVTGQPDREGWVLSPDGVHPHPSGETLAELEVDDRATLVLHEQRAAPPASATSQDTRSTPGASPPPTATRRAADTERPLRERTAQTLPARLARPARSWRAVRALVSTSPRAERSGLTTPGTLGPASLTRPARVSPLARMHEAWESTDYEHRLDRLVLGMRLRRCATIAVVSPKGGVGKTTTTALLGSLLAFLRRDRVVAVETNPDWGSLGRRLVPDHPIFIDDLLAGPLVDGMLSPTQLDAQLGRGPDGLMVAPAPTDPLRAQELDEAAYRTLFARLSELVGTLVLDCGTGLDDPPARAALACADQLVLVCDDEPDTASIVSEAAKWLQRIDPPLVLVVNNVGRSSRLEVAALEREVSFARGLAVIPRDERAVRQLHGSRYSWNRAPAGWRTPVRELAALLASDWRRMEIAH